MSKLMIAVEYFDDYHGKENDDNHSTMEIFETIAEAYKFASKVKYRFSFVADFNKKSIYLEEGTWNYDDHSVLYGYIKDLDFPDLIHFN